MVGKKLDSIDLSVDLVTILQKYTHELNLLRIKTGILYSQVSEGDKEIASLIELDNTLKILHEQGSKNFEKVNSQTQKKIIRRTTLTVVKNTQ
jgi:hypothetical protein